MSSYQARNAATFTVSRLTLLLVVCMIKPVETINIRTGAGRRADNSDANNPITADRYSYTRATFQLIQLALSTATRVADDSSLHD